MKKKHLLNIMLSESTRYTGYDKNPKHWNKHPNGKGLVHIDANVEPSVLVSPFSVVYGHSVVKGNVCLYNRTIIRGNACVKDKVILHGTACVEENAIVYGHVDISNETIIQGNSIIHGNSRILGNSTVTNKSRIYGLAYVHNSDITGCSEIHGDASVTNSFVDNSFVSGQTTVHDSCIYKCRVYNNAYLDGVNARNGNFNKCVICILGSGYGMCIDKNGYIHFDAIKRGTVSWWKTKGFLYLKNKIGYTNKRVNEYKMYIDVLSRILG